MQGASSLDAAMQLAKWYYTTFDKKQRNPDPQYACQKSKGRNPWPNSQNKSAQNGKPCWSGSTGASTSENN